MTPFLIFVGIPPIYAVANEANNILASSTSGTLTHWFKKTMDLKIGWMIIGGGLIGTAFGMFTFGYFKGIDKIDIVITLSYMYVLAIIGSFMLRDGIMEIDRIKKKVTIKKKLHTHYWLYIRSTNWTKGWTKTSRLRTKDFTGYTYAFSRSFNGI